MNPLDFRPPKAFAQLAFMWLAKAIAESQNAGRGPVVLSYTPELESLLFQLADSYSEDEEWDADMCRIRATWRGSWGGTPWCVYTITGEMRPTDPAVFGVATPRGSSA